MNITNQAEKARAFLALHDGPRILVLPNAWDVASARVFEDAGFPAIATTSAGVANSLGYADGQRIPRDEMLEVVERIAHAVDVPLSADMEAGYGSTPAEIAETTRAVISAGAVGMNLEDSSPAHPQHLAEVGLQCERIRAALDAAAAMGVELVLNARTDVFLEQVGQDATRFDATVARLNAYHAAGAPSLFVPGLEDAEAIGLLVRAIHGPLNILGRAGTPPIPELEQLGVARVSVGSGPMRATMGLLQRIARQLREEGSFALMTEGSMTFAEANRISGSKRGG